MTVAATEQHDVDRLTRHGENAHSIGEQAAATSRGCISLLTETSHLPRENPNSVRLLVKLP